MTTYPVSVQYNLRTFVILTVTQVVSILGSRMTAFALALWVTKSTGNATPLAMVAFFTILPGIILGNFGGMVADRYERRRVMALADSGSAVGTFLLLILFSSGRLELWHIYAVAFLQATCNTFQAPASEASVTMLVPDSQRDRANALRRMGEPTAGFLAPALAAMLAGLIGIPGVMIVDLITFFIAVTVVMILNIPNPPPSTEAAALGESRLAALSAGFRFLLARRILLFFVLQASLVNFVLFSSTTINLAYALARTNSDFATGAVASAENLGAIIGSIIIGIWGGTRPRIHGIMIGTIATGVALALFGMVSHPLLLFLTTFFIAVPISMANAPFFSMLQAKVPPDLQGRVFATVMQISLVLSPLGLLLVGQLADKVFEPAVNQPGWSVVAPLVGTTHGSGMGLIMLLSGSFIALISLLFYAIPAVRRMESTLPDYSAETAQ